MLEASARYVSFDERSPCRLSTKKHSQTVSWIQRTLLGCNSGEKNRQDALEISCLSSRISACSACYGKHAKLSERVNFRLPAKYLRGTHGKEQASIEDEHESHGGKSPLLVFINSGSGGHVGEQLAKYFKEALGRAQVYESATAIESGCQGDLHVKRMSQQQPF